MPPLRQGRMKVGKVECLVSFYSHFLIRSGVGECKVVLPEDTEMKGIWNIDVNTGDMQRLVDELGVDDRGACALVAAHEFGHVILLELGMSHDCQFHGGEPVAEWLAWRLAWPVLKRMEKGIAFMGHDSFVFPVTSPDVYAKARVMGLTSHRVDPNDKQVEADSDAWFQPRLAEFRDLMS